ncbi:MAG: hypothetical protein SGI74_02305 [Oligoflexia bacterium]|nr:hypothetical protein [Oligoflexia bacterium]
MDTKKYKTPQKNAGTRLRELSKKRRESIKPSKEFLEIFEKPAKDEEENKKSARPSQDRDAEV